MDVRRESADQWLRQPPLELFGLPGPEAERLAVLLPGWKGKPPKCSRVDRSAYCAAAFTWHYGERLDPEARRGLLSMLVLLWPRTTGRRPHDYQNHTADLLEAIGYVGDDHDRNRDRMRANAGADRRRVLSSIATRARETGELSSSWGIKVSEQREVLRADMLVEPLDPGVGDVLIDQAPPRPELGLRRPHAAWC